METTLVMMFVVVIIYLGLGEWGHHSQVRNLLDKFIEERKNERESTERTMKLLSEIKMLNANTTNYNMKKQSDMYEIELQKNQESPEEEEEDVGMIPNVIKRPDTVEEFLEVYGTESRGETWWDELYATYLTEPKEENKEGKDD